MMRIVQRRSTAIVVTLAALLIALSPAAFAGHGKSGGHHGHRRDRVPFILAFGTMYGVDGPFLNPVNAIRGTEGDTEAWKLTSARGFLGTDGRLVVHVRGLIFADGTPNDDANFRARVSCLTEDPAGTTPNADVTTEPFPATPSGDSDIDAHVTLPNPCVAPIVFILGGDEGKWFAVTGFEAEED